MSYTNIVWIKVFLSLFDEDERFLYHLNESQQLLFIKMLYLAAKTQNEIPKNHRFICAKINYSHDEECLNKDLTRISEVFRGFKINANSFSFKNFHKFHNYIGKSQGTPKESPSISQDKDKDKEYIKPDLKAVCLKYKEVKGITSIDTDWWSRHMKCAKKLLATYGSVDAVTYAIDRLDDEFRANKLNWTLETVLKRYTELSKPQVRYE